MHVVLKVDHQPVDHVKQAKCCQTMRLVVLIEFR